MVGTPEPVSSPLGHAATEEQEEGFLCYSGLHWSLLEITLGFLVLRVFPPPLPQPSLALALFKGGRGVSQPPQLRARLTLDRKGGRGSMSPERLLNHTLPTGPYLALGPHAPSD